MDTRGIEQVIFNVAGALLVPVLILVILSLGVVLIDAGAATAEALRRRGRTRARIDRAGTSAATALRESSPGEALLALRPIAWSDRMSRVLDALVGFWGLPLRDERAAKALADFDYASIKRLERSRLLVRGGPALGLMGTLIPLAPALAALAKGDIAELSQNLRVAFSVTILGLLIGVIAFGVSLVRDRIYSQDLSDLEYVAALLYEEPEERKDDEP